MLTEDTCGKEPVRGVVVERRNLPGEDLQQIEQAAVAIAIDDGDDRFYRDYVSLLEFDLGDCAVDLYLGQ